MAEPLSDLNPSADWFPVSPPVSASDLQSCDVVVIHYWAQWDLHDREMDRRIVAMTADYAGRVCVRSCDVDKPDNRPFICGIANIPALGCFIRGKWHESRIGLRAEAELRSFFDAWLAAAAAPAPSVLAYGRADDMWPLWRWFFVTWAGAAAAVWWFADWGVYIGAGPTERLKFIVPVWYQLLESAIFGACAAAMVVAIVRAIRQRARHAADEHDS